MKPSIVAAFAASAAASLPATAHVIVQQASAANVPIQVLGPNSSQQPAPLELSFQRFDPTIGQLDRVTARVTYQATASMGIENVEDSPATLNTVAVGVVHNLRFNGDRANAPVGFFTGLQASNIALPSFDGDLDFQGTSALGGGRVYAQTIDYVFDANSLTIQSNFPSVSSQASGVMKGAFVGHGPLLAELFMQSDVFVDAVGSRLFAVQQPSNETYSLAMQLTYEFTPVPAPAGVSAFGLIAASAARRRRR